ncbi:MAG: glycosyltransferase family 2 protein [Cyanobacteriota bacterium]|nr:glycosyltransferase family 2 protein [Cyanobacteriota bacterium]
MGAEAPELEGAADAVVLEAAAAAAEAQSNWPQAEQLWRQLLASQPEHGAGWHRLGKVLAQRALWADGLECQQRSCRLHPQLGWNWFAAAEALERLGRGEQAAGSYRQALWWLPQQSWIAAEAERAERQHWLGGETLAEGLGPQAYRHWCERLEPPLPAPGTALQSSWWLPRGPGAWRRLDQRQQVVEEQRGPWPDGAGWVLLLAADARLRREALQAMEQAIAQATDGASGSDPPPQLMYPDEDRLDGQGRRHDPWFKPGWVPESFWSSPWLEACSAWRLEWLRAQGLAPPPSGDAIALWAWQLAALARQPRVLAIPRVLVHRCGVQPANPEAEQARAAVLERQLRGQGEAVRVRPAASSGQFRLQWALPPEPPAVQVVIPSRDQAPLLERCLESLQGSCGRYPNLQITVVDHASREPATAALLAAWRRRLGDRFQVLRQGGRFNWSRLNNRAIRRGEAPLLLLLNNDVEALAAGWLEAMAAQALRPVVGAVGAVLLYPDHRIQHAGIRLGFGADGRAAEHAYRGLAWPATVHRGRAQLLTGWAAVTGACLMLRRQDWQRLGGLDERLPVEGNDVDLCLRLQRRGLRVVVEPAALLLHHECQSRDPRHSRSRGPAKQRLERLHPQLLSQGHPWLPGTCSQLHADGRPNQLDGYP